MRVSLFFVLVFLVHSVFGEESVFDQNKWNKAVETVLSSVVSGPFASHFTPEEMQAKVSREDRIRMQTNRLRAHVGIRLSESLSDFEIIHPFDHISTEVFLIVEKELREKGWNANWIPLATGYQHFDGSKGYLFVSLKK